MKSAIIIDETLPIGLLANAAACITTGLFNQVHTDDAYGPEIQCADCTLISITKIPILILKKGKRDFAEIMRRIEDNKATHMVFTHEAQSTAHYDEYVRRTAGNKLEDLTILGIGIIGEDSVVTKIAGDLPLLR